MKEKIFKKGIAKRLFSVVLALVMVVTLMPMGNIIAYAAGTTHPSDHVSFFYSYGKKWMDKGEEVWHDLTVGDILSAGMKFEILNGD